ncbi:EAL domain-containing protein [Legionella sp. W05-934-2]|uniref:sensor domain-containing protein n=1 Tax=Legionella sp. W05-934-2 TaxID=1198649 RepID=UPI0034628F66
MASPIKRNLNSNISEREAAHHSPTTLLIKKLLDSPPIYYNTKTWLNEVIRLISTAFFEQIVNITACKIMTNGFLHWCTSLNENQCYCKQMAASYCCQQWIAGKVGPSDIGKPLYVSRKKNSNRHIGVILHTDETTARAMVIECHSAISSDDAFIDEIATIFSTISLLLQNHLLKSNRHLLTTILKEAGDSVELTDANAVIEYVNPAFEKITGYSLEQAQGKSVAELIRSPNVDPQFFCHINQTLSEGKTWKGIIHSNRKDGGEWVAQSVIIPIKNLTGEVIKHLAIKQDITQQHLEQQQMFESEKRYRSIMNSTFDGIVIHDLQGNIIQVNRAVCESLGYDESELLQMHVRDIEVGVQEHDLHNIWNLLLTQDHITEGRHRQKDGSEFPVEVRLTCLVMDDEKLIIALIRDISEAKEYEEKLLYKANYDDLTKLPNRAYGLKHLQTTLDYADDNGLSVTVLFLDLDNFKQVNDTLGHFAGDQLLLHVSKRLKNVVRENDFVARLSGDEFMIVMPQTEDDNKIHSMIERLQLTFAQPFQIEGQIIHISASIGISHYPIDGEKSETLLRHADIAMYQSKSSGRGGWKTFVPDMINSAMKDLHFENAFRQALKNEDFDIHYQPIIDSQNGELVCFEALLRWVHPELGAVKPTTVIDFAEQLGLAKRLSRWILAQICRQAIQHQDHCQHPIKVAVNVSAQQINHASFVDDMKSVLNEYNVNPTQLIIELTESTLLLGKEEVHHQLNQLRDLGIAIAIDDFGVGYSSFSYLKDFPFSCLKIDKSFIKHLSNDSSYANLVKSMVTMAHCMNLKVVGEGVETKEQASILADFGCDYLQGWYIAKALPLEQHCFWLKKHR